MNDFAASLSATPSSLGIVPRGNRRHTLDQDDEADDIPDVNDDDEAQDLDALQFEMLAAWDDYKGAACTAMEAGIIIGRAAAKAKKLHGHGNFGKWIADNLPFKEVWCRTCVRAAVAYDMLHDQPKHALADAFTEADTIEKLAALANPAQGKLPAKRRLDLAGRDGSETDITDVTAKGEEGAPMDPATRLRVWEESLETREAALRVSLAALKRREWAVAARERAAGIDPEAAQAQAMADAEGALGPVETEAAPVLTPEAALIATAPPAPEAKAPAKRPSRAKAKAAEAPAKEAATHGAESIDEGRAMIAKADAQRAAKAAKVATPTKATKAPSSPTAQRQSRAKPKVDTSTAPQAENGSENDDTPM